MNGLRAVSGSQNRECGCLQFHGGGVRAQPEGFFFGVSHAFTFGPVQPVYQRVYSFFLPIEAPMEQTSLPLLCRLDAPSVVSPKLIAGCKTYRDAVRLCWDLRRVRNMTRRRLAEEAGLYQPHVSCYLNDNERSRDLPGSAVKAFEWVCGNTAISQWHATNARLTCLEEMQALKAVA
jgi:hypothetical protein